MVMSSTAGRYSSDWQHCRLVSVVSDDNVNYFGAGTTLTGNIVDWSESFGMIMSSIAGRYSNDW